MWRHLQATGSGWGWCVPTRTARWLPVAPMTRRCVSGWSPRRSAKLSCGSTNTWSSVSPGPQTALTPPSWRPQAQRYVQLLQEWTFTCRGCLCTLTSAAGFPTSVYSEDKPCATFKQRLPVIHFWLSQYNTSIGYKSDVYMFSYLHPCL